MRIVKGIDVSENNGRVDWNAVKDAGMEFAIVRSSYGRNNADEDFRRNVVGATMAGLKCGAYHYGYALTPYQARQEAENCRRVIDDSGVLLEMPVFYDMEDADGYKERNDFDFSITNCTEICRTFMMNLGLNTGIYASYDWLENHIDWRSLHEELKIPVWCAAWGDDDPFKGYMWQYTDSLEICGKVFDGNILYLPD